MCKPYHCGFLAPFKTLKIFSNRSRSRDNIKWNYLWENPKILVPQNLILGNLLTQTTFSGVHLTNVK